MWKNVNGVYTADPRVVPEAYSIPELKYDEAIVLDLFHQFTHDEGVVYGQRMASPQRSPCRIS